MADRSKVFRGDRLKKIRESKNLTQDDLNNMLSLGNTQIHRYETGKAEPSPDVLVRISRAIGVTTDYLLGLVDNPFENLQEGDLSPVERKLLTAFRTGEFRDLMRIAAEAEPKKPVGIVSPKPIRES